MFDLQIDRIESWVRGRGFSSVALQLPEGLKFRAVEISGVIFRDTGAEVVILGCPCYGACDLFMGYKKYAEGLIHFGHSPIPDLPQDPDVLYVEARVDVDISEHLVSVILQLPDRVGLLASVQYIHLLPEVAKVLEDAGKIAVIGKGNGRICHPGQVLGCNCSSATAVQEDVDAFLFLGEGDFHPLAAVFGVRKRVIILNPVTGEIRNVDDVKDRILRRRFAAIESARLARSFLVIVCGKVGQYRPDAADRIENCLRAAGKDVYRLVTDEITPDVLVPYKVDAYVSTACPRVAVDDQAKYRHPMLTVSEAEVVLGLRAWDHYVFDSI